MSEAKFSDGPWQAKPDAIAPATTTHLYGPSGKIATFKYRNHEADAQLGAAAPEMYEALQAHETALSFLESWEPDTDPARFREVADELYAQAERLAKAALSKATGGAS